MMRRFANSIALVGGVTCAVACSASTGDDPYTSAADEVELIAAALDEDMTGDEAEDAVSDDTMDGMQEAARRGRHHRGRRHRGGREGRGHLLKWFGDPEALQACRDMADACTPDDEACMDAVKECVHGVLEDAFAAMCEETSTMCEGDDAPMRQCDRIEAACSGDFDALRGGFGHGDGGLHAPRPPRGDFGDKGFGDRDFGGHDHDGRPAEPDAGMAP